jgi:hypothetical protein
MPVEGTKDLWMMHPDRFEEFEHYAIRAGYRLIDYKTVTILPRPLRLTR